MAGTSLRIAGASFSKIATSLTLPSRAGLVSEFVLGGDATQSARNLADLAVPGTVIGAPTYLTNYAVVGSGALAPGGANAGINTNKAATEDDQTFIAIARRNAAQPNNGGLIGPDNVAYGLVINGTTNTGATFYNSQNGVAPNVASITAAAEANFSFIVARGSVGALGDVTVARAGAVAAPVVAGQVGGARSAVTMRIGGMTTGSYSGNGGIDVAYYARFARILTPAEINAVYASLKAYYSGKIAIA